MVPVRGAPENAGTSKATDPFPLPVEPDRMTIQLASAEALHVH
jgi:hypothetical protein